MFRSKSLLIIFVLVLLAGISLYFYFSRSKFSTVYGDERNFGYKDTASITKIFIADKDGNQSAIERTNTGWVVNHKYPCRAEAILSLMEAIRYMQVKMPVAKEAKKNVIKIMSTRALKVQIFSGDELVKQYYVGHETEDAEGTYMILSNPQSGDNYENPFICFIPGFKGFLHPRFIAKETEWRDRLVVNYTPPQLKEIKVDLHDYPADSSFSIKLSDTKTFSLKNNDGISLPFDEAKMKQYLIYFQNISYEVLLSNKTKKLQDSLSGNKPFATITVLTKSFNSSQVFKFYRKQFTGDFNPELGINYTYDPDRFYLRFDGDKEWALCQYFVFGKLLVSRNYFNTAAATVKK